jgi:hypothetical protein
MTMWRDPIGRNRATQRVTWISATTGQSEWDQVWVISFLSPLRHHAHSTIGRERFPSSTLGKKKKKTENGMEKGEEGIVHGISAHGGFHAWGGVGLAYTPPRASWPRPRGSPGVLDSWAHREMQLGTTPAGARQPWTRSRRLPGGGASALRVCSRTGGAAMLLDQGAGGTEAGQAGSHARRTCRPRRAEKTRGRGSSPRRGIAATAHG